ncbi:carbohydrate ABC transporter permease [Streptomyces sp. NPDC060194]|uniref:carbohydrate ABC transporter permease n=1 Tax=Streptomyces sp. NPDC060194 TaxID=3347069 RepID=UPI003658132D
MTTTEAAPRPTATRPGPARPGSTAVRARRRKRVSGAAFYLAGTALGLLFLAPLLYSALSSVKTPEEANADPSTYLPHAVSFDNYAALFDYGSGLATYALNTLFVAVLTVLGTVVLSFLAGYGFSRLPFRGSNAVFGLTLVVLMVPYSTIIIPLYTVLGWFGLQDSLIGLSLVFITFQLPFSVFMMRNAFDAVPKELEEAARIDGAGMVQTLTRVSLPLVAPGLATVAMFAFLFAWNEFFAPLVFLTDSAKYTLPVMLLNVRTGQLGAVDFGALNAGVTLTMLPCLVLFLALQRYYISGLVAGSVKN